MRVNRIPSSNADLGLVLFIVFGLLYTASIPFFVSSIPGFASFIAVFVWGGVLMWCRLVGRTKHQEIYHVTGRRALVFWCLFSLLCIYFYLVKDNIGGFPDEERYLKGAAYVSSKLAAGNWPDIQELIHIEHSRHIGFGAFLGLLQTLGIQGLGLTVVNGLLVISCAHLSYKVAELMSLRVEICLLSALLMLFSLEFAFIAAHLLKEVLVSFLVMATIFFGIKSRRNLLNLLICALLIVFLYFTRSYAIIVPTVVVGVVKSLELWRSKANSNTKLFLFVFYFGMSATIVFLVFSEVSSQVSLVRRFHFEAEVGHFVTSSSNVVVDIGLRVLGLILMPNPFNFLTASTEVLTLSWLNLIGSAVWALIFPFAVWGCFKRIIERDVMFLALVLGAVAYIVVIVSVPGLIEGRHRLTISPLLYIFAAQGILDASRKATILCSFLSLLVFSGLAIMELS